MIETLYLIRPRGFCAGVVRAIEIVERALVRYGVPVYVRKEIVHNPLVVADLRTKGAIFVESLGEVPRGSVVIFSAHGVAPDVYEDAAERQLEVIDATCPLVTKVHIEARRYAREDRTILLIGHPGHDEVIGTMGEAPGKMTLISDTSDLDKLEGIDPSKLAFLTQTTLSVVCVRTASLAPSGNESASTSSGVSTRVMLSGASPIVPITSSCPSWPTSRMW
jgi:4-hydroxy-3-methylbut-2-enyl diphosphate reductase